MLFRSNNVLLVSALATVFIGTFYPLFIDLIGNDKISVGPPYYAATFVPLVIPLLVAMVVGPMLRWQRDDLVGALSKLRGSVIVAGLVAAGVLIATRGKNLLAAGGLALAAWVIAGSFAILLHRVRAGAVPFKTSLQMALALPRASHGVIVAHLGMGLLIAGVTGTTVWKSEDVLAMRPGDVTAFAGYSIALKDVKEASGPDYQAQQASFTVTRGSGAPVPAAPELRFYLTRQMQTTEAAIQSGPLGNLYVSIGEKDDSGKWTVRLYYHPLVVWIWIGAIAMAAGGVLSLSGAKFFAFLRRPRPHMAATHAVAAE